MGGSLRIARIAGIDIKVHFTFLFVVLLGAWQWSATGARGAVFGAVLMLAVFACVALHELGHSLVAQAFGVPVKEIILLPIGGVAQLGRKPRRPVHELLIALAGPAVNVVLAVALLAALLFGWGEQALLPADALVKSPPTALTLVEMLFVSNVVLAVFNLVPAFPMDGGRVLRAFLAWWLGEPRATRLAAGLGRVIAVLLFVWGVVAQSPMLPVVAVFVYFGARAELFEVELADVLEGIRTGDAVNPYAPRFMPGTTVGEAMQALIFTPFPAFAVEHFGRLVGVVSREALIRQANEEGPGAFVAGAMDRSPPLVSANAPLEAARTAMRDAGKPYVAVADGEVLLGLVTEAELARQVALARQLRGPAQRKGAPRAAER